MPTESPDVPVRPRPGGRTARNRALVLDAVLAELTEHGYDALTVDAVAARAGVHRATVYRRWRDVAACSPTCSPPRPISSGHRRTPVRCAPISPRSTARSRTRSPRSRRSPSP
ncbi:TetR/AcrR family transcriptional regulator [Nocardia neocaledoniensis]|uniref:TetR/AcrR family transcriptional regulator n=1 Tax=Nocardia neocaledoniensis TaxID=236511 RepID=UPI0024589367|nr:helix-turn-helix domain-containing protein [Nocardia neocaledoniensis]